MQTHIMLQHSYHIDSQLVIFYPRVAINHFASSAASGPFIKMLRHLM